jgi:alanine racemase
LGVSPVRPASAQGDPGGLPGITSRTWAEIDLDAVRENTRALLGALSSSRRPGPAARLMAVVKADAYGHGATQVGRAALDAGAWGLGVATVHEGIELRRAGLDVPILVLGPSQPEEAGAAVAHDLRMTVFRREIAMALSRAARLRGRAACVHLKVDTGMGRIGVAPQDAPALAREVSALPGIVLEGCFTHLATADEEVPGPAQAQVAVFRRVLDEMARDGLAPALRHAANSAAVLSLPEAHFDLVRCGIALYGIAPAPHLAGRVTLRPVMRLCARVAQVKRVAAGTPVGYGRAYRAPRATTIVTVPAGYADGYPRLAGEAGHVLLRGRRLPIAGRISMDQMTIDGGDAPVEIGDEVQLWGPSVPVEEVASAARTIAYEVLARVSRRVPRVFIQGGRVCAVRTLLSSS